MGGSSRGTPWMPCPWGGPSRSPSTRSQGAQRWWAHRVPPAGRILPAGPWETEPRFGFVPSSSSSPRPCEPAWEVAVCTGQLPTAPPAGCHRVRGVTVSRVSPVCVCVCVPVHGTGMLGSVDERGAVRAGWYVCMGVQEGWGLCVRGCCVCVHGRARKHECAWVCEGPGGWGCVQGGVGVRGCQRVHGCARGPACARGGWCAHGRGREPV